MYEIFIRVSKNRVEQIGKTVYNKLDAWKAYTTEAQTNPGSIVELWKNGRFYLASR